MMMRRRSVQDSRALRLCLLFRPRRVLRPTSGRVLSAFLKLRREAEKPAEVFDAGQMKRLLQWGQPHDAYCYLQRFSPVSSEDWSELLNQLYVHVGVFKILARVGAGGEEGRRTASVYAKPIGNSGITFLHETIAVLQAHHTRAPMIWQKIKPAGVNRIMELVAMCPELQGDKVKVPRREAPMLSIATPSPCGTWQGLIRSRKIAANHTPSHVLACTFLRKRLLSTQRRKRKSTYPGIISDASSSSGVFNSKIEEIPLKPIILKVAEEAKENSEAALK